MGVGVCGCRVFVSVVAYAVVNYARFRSLFGIPWTKYQVVAFDANYQLTLAHNDNNVFGAKFVPTALLQYLRPDALAPSTCSRGSRSHTFGRASLVTCT